MRSLNGTTITKGRPGLSFLTLNLFTNKCCKYLMVISQNVICSNQYVDRHKRNINLTFGGDNCVIIYETLS